MNINEEVNELRASKGVKSKEQTAIVDMRQRDADVGADVRRSVENAGTANRKERSDTTRIIRKSLIKGRTSESTNWKGVELTI
jgi:hypothetical protein